MQAFFIGGLGWPEILIIALIIIILFGARRIPEVAKGLGEGIRSFKKGMRDDEGRELEDRGFRDDTERREKSHRSA